MRSCTGFKPIVMQNYKVGLNPINLHKVWKGIILYCSFTDFQNHCDRTKTRRRGQKILRPIQTSWGKNIDDDAVSNVWTWNLTDCRIGNNSLSVTTEGSVICAQVTIGKNCSAVSVQNCGCIIRKLVKNVIDSQVKQTSVLISNSKQTP